jgi:hypothetical protein
MMFRFANLKNLIFSSSPAIELNEMGGLIFIKFREMILHAKLMQRYHL